MSLRAIAQKTFLKGCLNKPSGKAVQGLFYTGRKDRGTQRFLFAQPSYIEIILAGDGLRLIGGMGERLEGMFNTLAREAKEEIVGNDVTHGKVEATPDQKKAMDIIDRAIMRLRYAKSEIYIHKNKGELNPGKYPEQKMWTPTKNKTVAVRLSSDEFNHILKVGKETAQNKGSDEIGDIIELSSDELSPGYKLREDFVWENERDAVRALLARMRYTI